MSFCSFTNIGMNAPFLYQKEAEQLLICIGGNPDKAVRSEHIVEEPEFFGNAEKVKIDYEELYSIALKLFGAVEIFYDEEENSGCDGYYLSRREIHMSSYQKEITTYFISDDYENDFTKRISKKPGFKAKTIDGIFKKAKKNGYSELAELMEYKFYGKKKPKEVFDGIRFGSYYNKNGLEKEPIEWIILDEDEEGLLLLSRRIIDVKPFHNDMMTFYTLWFQSDIREWLNGEFLETAFTEEERERIFDTELETFNNPEFETWGGRDTTDKVFLLSIEEALHYLSPKQYQAKPTPYSKAKKIETQRGMGGAAWWWLRSSGCRSETHALACPDASIDYCGILSTFDDVGIRPAIWVEK